VFRNHEDHMRKKLLAGKATLAEGLQLYSQITERGEPFPLELEEIVLKLGLNAEPDRDDLVSRLRYVLKAQDKPIPSHIEEVFAVNATREEWEKDHQRAASDYHQQSELRDMDPGFFPLLESCRRYSMVSVERMYALFKAVHYIEGANVEGDIVECGVWRGGSMMMVASTLLSLNRPDRDLYLFDTFEGLPRPDEQADVDIWGNRAIDGWLPNSINEESSHWAEADEEEVRRNLYSTGFPHEHLHFIKGMVERTIPDQAPEKIALLRLDTDWYQSTKHELDHLFDRVSSGGVLIIDDYGHFKGARKAVDEFLERRGISILLNRIDYSGRLAIKI